jgi:hypothetical protein
MIGEQQVEIRMLRAHIEFLTRKSEPEDVPEKDE